MLHAPEAVPATATFVCSVSPLAAAAPWSLPGPGFLPGGSVHLSQVQVGETTYPLRRPVRSVSVPNGRGGWEFWVDGFSPRFVGRGACAEAAYRDWRDQVHEAFQALYRMRPFEMGPDERQAWDVLEGLIDVIGYQNDMPVLVRQLGQITQARPLPRQITWVDGTKETDIDLGRMPDEFAGYKPGQWFEAIVERDPRTWRLRRVRFVQRTPSIPSLSGTALEPYWTALPSADSLPGSKRDWTSR